LILSEDVSEIPFLVTSYDDVTSGKEVMHYCNNKGIIIARPEGERGKMN